MQSHLEMDVWIHARLHSLNTNLSLAIEETMAAIVHKRQLFSLSFFLVNSIGELACPPPDPAEGPDVLF